MPRCAASSSSRPPSARRRAAGRRASRCDTTRRFGPQLLLAAQRIAGGIALPGTHPADARERLRRTRRPSPASAATAGSRCFTYDTERAEAEHLADLLRRAHLEDGIAWDDMAVLVRSGRTSIPGPAPLARRCRGAGRGGRRRCPARCSDPAALPLLDALRAVLNLDNDDPDHVDFIDPRGPRRC